MSRPRIVDSLRFLDSKQSVVEDTHGNISCRVGDRFLIKPSGMTYSDITQADICEVRLSDGSYFREGRVPSVDTEHHRSVYQRNPGVGSICHTHSPYATAWAAIEADLPVVITEHADYFGHQIRCLEFASLDQWGSIDLLDDEQAVLLGHHGALICSRDPDPMSAAKLAVALEIICKKYFLINAIAGTGPTVVNRLSNTEVRKWHDRYQNRYGQ